MNKTPLNLVGRNLDYHRGDGQLKIKGVTTSNWISHFDFFVSQQVDGNDTDDCWDFGATKNLDAFMDALISDGLLPQAVVQQITAWGFMDTGIDGKLHFHSSERWAGILSGLGQNGGTLYDAYDIFRKNGVVPFRLLPVTPTMTISEYFDPTSITQELRNIGTQFLALMGGQDFCQYQWVVENAPTNIPEMATAIVDGPLLLGIPVDDAGWNQVHPVIATGTSVHVVSAYEVQGSSVLISDNYAPYLKVLDPGYQISYVMQMIVQYIAPAPTPAPTPVPTLPPNPTVPQEISWLDAILIWLQNLSNSFQGRNQKGINMTNFSIFKSRTFYTGLLMFVYAGLSAILPSLHSGAGLYITDALEAIGFVLVTYFHVNPSQVYNPIPPVA